MFADTLFAAERLHLTLLLLWGLGSVLGGTAMWVVWVRFRGSALLYRFGQVTVIWGVGLAVMAIVGWSQLELRDFGGAMRLERTLWLSAGLDVGAVAAGCTLAITSWVYGRRIGGVGAGLAVIVQGVCLLALHTQLLKVLAG